MIMGADDVDEGTRPLHVGFQGHSRNEDPVRGVNYFGWSLILSRYARRAWWLTIERVHSSASLTLPPPLFSSLLQPRVILRLFVSREIGRSPPYFRSLSRSRRKKGIVLRNISWKFSETS